MRIGRTIIIKAIVALGVAGSIAASVAVPAATEAAPSAHVHTVAVAHVPQQLVSRVSQSRRTPNGLPPIYVNSLATGS